MKYIEKSAKRPKGLIPYLKQAEITPTYADCPFLDEWSDILLEEQGYLCAYTMMRIQKGRGNMKREHIIPQNGTPGNDLDHQNLVAVCMGNEGCPPERQYADTKKGNHLLKRLTPMQPTCEQLLKYRRNGEIYSDDKEAEGDIKDILNLNYEELVANRRAAWNAVQRRLDKRG